MSKGKRLSELDKFKRAIEDIDFTLVNVDELNVVIEECQKKSLRATIQKQIDELQKRLEEL